MLCLGMRFAQGNHLHEDTRSLQAEPFWEIKFLFFKQTLDTLTISHKTTAVKRLTRRLFFDEKAVESR